MATSREVVATREMAGEDEVMATAVEKAVKFLGRGVDMTFDLRLKHCKGAGGCLVVRSGEKAAAKVAVPGLGVVIADMPDVKCGKGDRIRFKSDVLEFNKVCRFSCTFIEFPLNFERVSGFAPKMDQV
jgi:hypothetical protein